MLRGGAPQALAWRVRCPHCESAGVAGQGHDTAQPSRRKHRCTACRRYFDDLAGTPFAGHRQPLRVWILCLCLMGIDLSSRQIAQEPGLDKDDARRMAEQPREGIVAEQPEPVLSGGVECDEVHVVGGHKGHPGAVKKRP